MDRLEALETFKCVVDQGGFARAAADLDVSCAKVSRTVQDLELMLGVQLLNRTTRRVSLTSVGHELLAKATEVLETFEQLKAMSSMVTSEPSGTVRVGAPAGLARQLLGAVLAEFVASFPSITVDLRVRSQLSDVFEDEVDVMLCVGQGLRDSLIARNVGSLEVAAYASPLYLMKSGVPEGPEDLASHKCLVWDGIAAGPTWALTRRRDGATAEIAIKGPMRCSQADVLMGAVCHGAGIALLPSVLVSDAVSSGSLAQVLPCWVGASLPVQLAWGSRRNLPLAVRKLIDHLVENVKLGPVTGTELLLAA